MVKNLSANTEHIGNAVLSLGREGPLEEGMATHSRILAWRIPWKEKPGGLRSIKSDTAEATYHARTDTSFRKCHSVSFSHLLIYMCVSVHIYTCKNELNFYVF